jgi:hypothetical protein
LGLKGKCSSFLRGQLGKVKVSASIAVLSGRVSRG